MCKVSDKLRLCTCATDYNQLKHYWTFHRFVEGMENYIIGETMLPYRLSATDHEANYVILNILLNEGNPFDVELLPVKKDRLHLSFTCIEGGDTVSYGFQYTGRRWKRQEYCSLMWYWHHEEVQGGKVKNALHQTRSA